MEWERSFGGMGYESARDILQTDDGGFIVLGETNSTDGGVVAGFGGSKDIWILKLDATGNLVWQKRFGGTGLDIGNRIIATSDGNYLIAASTSSNDGNVSGNHGVGGFTDGLLMKISATGNLIWSKCFGGSKNEELLDVKIINGKIFAAGYTNSIDGDIPPSQKNYDTWLLALDANGNKIFSRIYGGSQNDVAYCMTVGADASITLAGYTTSNDGDVKGAKGSQDYWVLNLAQSGNLNWQKVLGGSNADYAQAIMTDADGSYIVAGLSYSDDGDVANPLGLGDYWLVKLSPSGNIFWKQNLGGSGNDHLRSIIYKPVLNEYYLSGDTESGGDFTGGFGDVDFGIIKCKLPDEETKDTAVCDKATFIPVTDTLRDACGYDSVYIKFRPVPINGPFDGLKKSDTIFVGQSVIIHTSGNGNIVWNSAPTLSCLQCANPVATPTVTTTYTAVNTLPSGCRLQDRFTVVVMNDAVVFTPNAFTPNNDGMNDFFGPLGKVPDGFSMQIFNRYGQPVFKSSSMNSRWDGRFQGSHQPMGSFIYIISFKDIHNNVHQQKGTFTLIR